MVVSMPDIQKNGFRMVVRMNYKGATDLIYFQYIFTPISIPQKVRLHPKNPEIFNLLEQKSGLIIIVYMMQINSCHFNQATAQERKLLSCGHVMNCVNWLLIGCSLLCRSQLAC